jgi:hypothetical protein
VQKYEKYQNTFPLWQLKNINQPSYFRIPIKFITFAPKIIQKRQKANDTSNSKDSA